MSNLQLPDASGALAPFAFSMAAPFPARNATAFPRLAYAAAHVCALPNASGAIDWERTLAFRHRLWDLGFSIAEAMDTAQRGAGLDWPMARQLITRVLAEARTRPGAELASGAGTDQLDPANAHSLADVIGAYEDQFAHIEGQGGRAIMMASRALVRIARGPDDYAFVYDRVLAQARRPVILHWLGEMFDPALQGYWGVDGFDAASRIVLDLIARHAPRVAGIKISLLDAQKEIALRARLPDGVAMFTGDDFHYDELIAGDGAHYSHALLGIFDAIAPAAAAALLRLGAGDRAAYDSILAPTIKLSRKIFEAPTQNYKCGLAFLAWLNGYQEHFAMLGGLQSARGVAHYCDVLRLADAARLIQDPGLAGRRVSAFLKERGVAA